MEIKNSYKKTDIGVIPMDWDCIELGESVSYVKGFAFKSKDYRSNGIRIIRVSDTTYDSIKDDSPIYIDFLRSKEFNNWKIHENDIVLSTVGSKPPMYDSLVGKAVLINCNYEGALLNQNAVILRSKKANQKLIYENLKRPNYIKYIEKIIRGNANQASITLVDLFKYKFALPRDLVEQQAIANALSDVNGLITSLTKLIKKKNYIKQGALQELLTGKKRLEGFSERWEVRVLSDIFDFHGGHSASREQLSILGYCYLHYGDIHGSSKTYIDVDNEYMEIPKLNISLSKISKVKLLEDGDVVFVDASEDDDGTSRHVVVKNPNHLPFISGLHTIVAKIKNDLLDKEFRQYCFQSSEIKSQFKFYAVGTKVSGISRNNIAKINLRFPASKDEQAAIANILSDMDFEIKELEQKLYKYKNIKQGMMQELLTGRIRLL